MRISRNPVFSILVFHAEDQLSPGAPEACILTLSSQLPFRRVDMLSRLHECGFKGHRVSRQLGTWSQEVLPHLHLKFLW